MRCFPTQRVALAAAVLSVLFAPVHAGEAGGASADAIDAPPAAEKQKDAMALDTITVTGATKRGPKNVQEVPLAVTAFGEQQLQEQNFRTLGSLGYSMPNVQMDDVGTTPGVANFSIRGLGINSSIPSLDPTVGVFIDGVYMGITNGMVFDNFDLDSIEVLRGPQGILFGRNVTGGAVLLKTRTPGDTFEADARLGVESGLRTVFDATVMGPLSPTLSGKLAVYAAHDDGWFTNKADGKDEGGSNTRIMRGALAWRPSEDFDIALRVEDGKIKGEGPPTQNPALFSPDSHDVEAGPNKQHYRDEWTQAFVEANWKVGFGDGKITDVFGWRKFTLNSMADIDATSNFAFEGWTAEKQKQYSNELRYAGTFGPVDVTAGTYGFTQDLDYVELRKLDFVPPYDGADARVIVGGGKGTFSTEAAFLAADWHFADRWMLNLGARYTHEKKEADVARMRPGGGSLAGYRINPDFPGLHKTWNDVSPKVGLQWQPAADTQLYGFWAKGFRSGGYNFRHTVLTLPVQAFDSEEQSSYELGIKKEFREWGLRVNADLFHDKIDNIQRESNDPSITGVQQIIRNVGDATVEGAEIEARLALPAGFTLAGNAGYIRNKYDKLFLDISGDGKVTPADYALKLPRAPKWTYGLSLFNDLDLGDRGLVSTRVSYSHRDESFYSDNNLAKLPEVDMVDFNVTWTPPGEHWSFSVYGENMLNEVIWGGNTVLPNIPAFGGGTASVTHAIPAFRPLDRGRVVGAEVRYKF